MADEYRVPAILQEIRELRRTATPSEIMDKLPPHLLYARCEKELNGSSRSIVQTLYNHVFAEAGYILDAPRDKGGKPYPVCPVCGYVFEA